MFSSWPWHFMMLRSGLREVEIRVWQKQNATALDLSSLCRQWHRWPAHACSLQGWKMPLSQRRAAWSHWDGRAHIHTHAPHACAHARIHACMSTLMHTHTLPSAACYIAPPSRGTCLLQAGCGASCWPISWVFPSILVSLRDSSEMSE